MSVYPTLKACQVGAIAAHELWRAIIQNTMTKDPKKQRPPFLLHLLAGFFLLALPINVSGIVQTVNSWNWLLAAGYFPHPVYAVFKGFIIAIGSLVAAISLWGRFSWSARYAQVMATLIILWFWVDRVFLTRNPLPFSDHLFPMLVSALILIFVLVSLWLLQPWMKTATPKVEPDFTESEDE